MGTFGFLWKGTRDDIASLGKASRPPRPGVAPQLSAEDQLRAHLAYLDRNASNTFSPEGYARLEELLKAAQASPAGRAKKTKKTKKKTGK
jgi:hypothetical protein